MVTGYSIDNAFTNFKGDVIFKTSITLPSGETTTDFTNYIYTTFDSFHCKIANETSSVITLGTEAYTTTYSTTEITNVFTGDILGAPYTSVDTIHYIMTPAAISSSSLIPSSSDIATSSSVPSTISSLSVTVSSSIRSSSVVRTSDVYYSSSISSMKSSMELFVVSSSVSNSLPSSVTSSHDTLSLTSDSSSTTSHYSGTSTSQVNSFITSNRSYISRTIVSSQSFQSKKDGVSTMSSEVTSYSSSSIQFSNSSSIFGSIYTGSVNSIILSTSRGSSRSNSEEQSSNIWAYPVSESESHKSSERQKEISRSTSTYADEHGVTKTVIVDCATKSNNNDAQFTSTSNVYISNVIDGNGNTIISTISNKQDATTQVIEIPSSRKENFSSSGNKISDNTKATVTVKQQTSNSPSSSPSLYVQQIPNIAGRSIGSLVICIMSLMIQLCLI